ncbi:MAG TPA: glycosyltransferase family 4 protein [Solirubrobacteraceae bacterium]|nr:glycosyltransferase family 4 protein [Solirubrobacteraceae bacterium]
MASELDFLGGDGSGRRLLVVSHPAIVDVNQLVYRELMRRGWSVTVVLPTHWRSEYSGARMAPTPLPGMEQALRPTPVVLAGRPQRHLYLTRCRATCRRVLPDVAFVEAEPYSLPSFQWAFAFTRLGIPFGVQCYENIDRPLPTPIRALRGWLLRHCAFVAARSRTAGELARDWGAHGEIGFAPPAVPGWELRRDGRERPFTVGYAGRLVPSKGLADLLAAVRRLPEPVQLLLIGDGELRGELEGQPVPGSRVRVLSGIPHDRMNEAYAQIDVLVLPSRTTPTWKEQFGRVIVEALWCGVPVVGSDSGEIPWLVELTGGGLVFAEGDSAALADRLEELRAAPRLRQRLAEEGRAAVERMFTVASATDALERLLSAAARPPAPSTGARARASSAPS